MDTRNAGRWPAAEPRRTRRAPLLGAAVRPLHALWLCASSPHAWQPPRPRERTPRP